MNANWECHFKFTLGRPSAVPCYENPYNKKRHRSVVLYNVVAYCSFYGLSTETAFKVDFRSVNFFIRLESIFLPLISP